MTLLPNTLPNTTKVNLLKHEVRLVEGSEVRPVLKGEVSWSELDKNVAFLGIKQNKLKKLIFLSEQTGV